MMKINKFVTAVSFVVFAGVMIKKAIDELNEAVKKQEEDFLDTKNPDINLTVMEEKEKTEEVKVEVLTPTPITADTSPSEVEPEVCLTIQTIPNEIEVPVEQAPQKTLRSVKAPSKKIARKKASPRKVNATEEESPNWPFPVNKNTDDKEQEIAPTVPAMTAKKRGPKKIK